jgi:hypothetical protein
MKDRATGVLASAATGLTTALAGARWWAVLLVVVVILVLNDGVVCWLAIHSKANRITTLLITWEREPSKRQDSW